MAAKAIMKMKNGKAAEPSGIVAEMMKASGGNGVQLVADLAHDMITNGTIPSEWENTFIINICKGKGDTLIRDNYRGLKFLDHVMKVIERVMQKIIRERVFIHGKTDAIFILRQLQEKHLAKNRKLYFTFIDFEKTFNQVPRKVSSWVSSDIWDLLAQFRLG